MDQAKSLWIQQSYELLTVIKEEPDVETLIQFLAAYYEVMKLAFFFCFEREYSGVFFYQPTSFSLATAALWPRELLFSFYSYFGGVTFLQPPN